MTKLIRAISRKLQQHVIRKISYPTAQSLKILPFLVNRCRIPCTSKLVFNSAANFQVVRPKNSNCDKLPSCPGSRPTPTEISATLRNFRNSQHSYAKMMNFGEHGHHNILHNFGIQRMKRFRRSIARKLPFLSLVSLFGQQPELG